jgi:hypothetical protein
MAIAEREDLELRRSYTQTLKKLSVDQRFRNHTKKYRKARKADRKVKTITGRLLYLKKYYLTNVATAIKFIACTSHMYNSSAKGRNIKNMSSGQKFLSPSPKKVVSLSAHSI